MMSEFGETYLKAKVSTRQAMRIMSRCKSI